MTPTPTATLDTRQPLRGFQATCVASRVKGNLTDGGSFTFTWGAENRLIAVEPAASPVEGDEKLEFTYDYMGRRVEKVAWTWDGGAEEWDLEQRLKFVYDEWNVILVLDGTDDDFIWGSGQADATGKRVKHLLPKEGDEYGDLRSLSSFTTDSILIP